MTDAWAELQALKLHSKTLSIRERMQQRKLAREDVLKSATEVDVSPLRVDAKTAWTSLDEAKSSTSSAVTSATTSSPSAMPSPPPITGKAASSTADVAETKVVSKPLPLTAKLDFADSSEIDLNLEIALLETFEQDNLFDLPMDVAKLCALVPKVCYDGPVSIPAVNHLLHKFSLQRLIVIEDSETQTNYCSVVSVDSEKIAAFCDSLGSAAANKRRRKRKHTGGDEEEHSQKQKLLKHGAKASLTDIDSLLALPSAKEKETKKLGGEILELLNKATAKEQSLIERFRSSAGSQVKEFCAHGTKEDCQKTTHDSKPCTKLHFRKIIQKHTDTSLGDCSFLNTCFHMNTCKYIHYEVDYSTLQKDDPKLKQIGLERARLAMKFNQPIVLYPPQWIQCDLRSFDLSTLGKFSVVMADPPWDIHMELPYGTMADEEMRQLNIKCLQDEGLLFLWVTGRAMELGRDCLRIWGYVQCDEIIWVKTNQLQRIIRTGRTGHWLNHGKEHCLVGIKGSTEKYNRGLDCDVIVAEVRATSHKPDEIYGIIERLSPGTRKLELFGRPHNVQPNWITLGNQLDGVRLLDPDVVSAFKERYPDGNCIIKT